MLSHVYAALQPAGLLLVGVGLLSLIFAERLAGLDGFLDSFMIAKVDPEYSHKWVVVTGGVWSIVGLALLFGSRFIR